MYAGGVHHPLWLGAVAFLLFSLGCQDASDESIAAPDAASLRALASACAPVAGTRPFATDVTDQGDPEGAGTVEICGLDGAIWWRADMDVDCDGGQGQACLSDASYLPDTATTDADGAPLDASTLPYVVVPLPWNPTGPRDADFFYCDHGLTLGGVVAAIYGDEVVYGVIGDEGPVTAEPAGADGECGAVPFAGGVVGEASYAMAAALGIDPDPNVGGVDCGPSGCPVLYILFAGEALDDPGDAAAAEAEGEQRARALLAKQ